MTVEVVKPWTGSLDRYRCPLSIKINLITRVLVVVGGGARCTLVLKRLTSRDYKLMLNLSIDLQSSQNLESLFCYM
ncbi:hypothetical protein WICANDRAFT_98195 [Wickerhamomyces anomalus NRRL Y-366-8]|uniref:Uncharacterized protein n=1 Tax=Wickerhamomyces anomalus (strain ATCC 58044 / CBS 1984 / NCYC 433 / NRRL Y-366-8) TaxID=683960 RepID=A0A1E3NU50_WICAA|nr:uncharacterized protein WICANDRAFT_98195 [Wickerhamomyces anomalus NRRL Y-366-8]ODQ56711.1 hypothetical protein WICANDRAFT_98195 [Wickerhamomyces anomalus NRRL Y-366-8]